ncbi:TPA: hypothetical protein ACGIK9_002912 [Acinetobacter baumannii]|uniref:hypothetical protein n=1 Tax=Acinetobacter baumannii TaxID=470 RepID=UPI00338EB029
MQDSTLKTQIIEQIHDIQTLKGLVEKVDSKNAVIELNSKFQDFSIPKINLSVKNNILGKILLIIAITIAIAIGLVFTNFLDFSSLYQTQDIQISLLGYNKLGFIHEWFLPVTIASLILLFFAVIIISILYIPVVGIIDKSLQEVHVEMVNVKMKNLLLNEISKKAYQISKQQKKLQLLIDEKITQEVESDNAELINLKNRLDYEYEYFLPYYFLLMIDR